MTIIENEKYSVCISRKVKKIYFIYKKYLMKIVLVVIFDYCLFGH